MPRMDRETRRAMFWSFVRKKEQDIGPTMRYNIIKSDSYELELINAPLWEQYRKEAIESEHPRDGYVFQCAERFGKKIQNCLDSYVELYGKEPDEKYLFNDIRSCKDFSFFLKDNAGRDCRKAVEWLSMTAKYGDKIKEWFERDVAEIKRQQKSESVQNIYIQSGASSAPESNKERRVRIEENQRHRNEDLLLKAFSKVTITGNAYGDRDPAERIKMNLGIDFTKPANCGKNRSEFFVIQSEMQNGAKDSALIRRISVDLDPNAKLEDILDGAMLLAEWGGAPVTFKVGKKEVVVKHRQDRFDILQENPQLEKHFKQESKELSSNPLKRRSGRYGFLSIIQAKNAVKGMEQPRGSSASAEQVQGHSPYKKHPGFSSQTM